ncbi:unnamed protein product [Cunninghamella blakesleeana]
MHSYGISNDCDKLTDWWEKKVNDKLKNIRTTPEIDHVVGLINKISGEGELNFEKFDGSSYSSTSTTAVYRKAKIHAYYEMLNHLIDLRLEEMKNIVANVETNMESFKRSVSPFYYLNKNN